MSSLVTLVIVGVIALVVYDKITEKETGLAGTWALGQEKLTIVKSGPGAYYFKTLCDGQVHLTGSDTRVTGKVPARDQSGGGTRCGPLQGYTTVTITVGANHDTARLTETMPPDETDEWTCLTCGTRTMTRVG